MPITDWTSLPFGWIKDWTDAPDSPHLEQENKVQGPPAPGLIESTLKPMVDYWNESPNLRRFVTGELPPGYPKVMPDPVLSIPGTDWLAEKASHAIDPSDKPFYTGARPLMGGMAKTAIQMIGGGIDPRAATLRSPRPEVLPPLPTVEDLGNVPSPRGLLGPAESLPQDLHMQSRLSAIGEPAPVEPSIGSRFLGDESGTFDPDALRRGAADLFKGSEGKGLGEGTFDKQWEQAIKEAEAVGIDWKTFDNLDDLQWQTTRKAAQITKDTGTNPLMRFIKGEEGTFDPQQMWDNLKQLLGRDPTEEEVQQGLARQVRPGEETGRVASFARPEPPSIEPKLGNQLSSDNQAILDRLRNQFQLSETTQAYLAGTRQHDTSPPETPTNDIAGIRQQNVLEPTEGVTESGPVSPYHEEFVRPPSTPAAQARPVAIYNIETGENVTSFDTVEEAERYIENHPNENWRYDFNEDYPAPGQPFNFGRPPRSLDQINSDAQSIIERLSNSNQDFDSLSPSEQDAIVRRDYEADLQRQSESDVPYGAAEVDSIRNADRAELESMRTGWIRNFDQALNAHNSDQIQEALATLRLIDDKLTALGSSSPDDSMGEYIMGYPIDFTSGYISVRNTNEANAVLETWRNILRNSNDVSMREHATQAILTATSAVNALRRGTHNNYVIPNPHASPVDIDPVSRGLSSTDPSNTYFPSVTPTEEMKKLGIPPEQAWWYTSLSSRSRGSVSPSVHTETQSMLDLPESPNEQLTGDFDPNFTPKEYPTSEDERLIQPKLKLRDNPYLTRQQIDRLRMDLDMAHSNDFSHDFTREELDYQPNGEPGLSIDKEHGDVIAIYRDASGRPVAMARGSRNYGISLLVGEKDQPGMYDEKGKSINKGIGSGIPIASVLKGVLKAGIPPRIGSSISRHSRAIIEKILDMSERMLQESERR